MSLIVQKYGGATVADPKKIKQVAVRLAELQRSSTQVVAVVSAMGQTTNELLNLASQVAARPNRRELDMLLSTGERVSMALLTMALHDQGCAAISFTGSQAGILTDTSHLNAFIQDVRAPRVEQALAENKIVVLAGFQGVSPVSKEITTLGRGGSDVTAIAMAAALKADRCEILKDVPAVFSADPKIVPDAKSLPHLSYDQLMEMTFWGAKVLHYRSVELAKQKQVQLFIGAAESTHSKNGTVIDAGGAMFESHRILSLNSHATVLQIQAAHAELGDCLSELQSLLHKNEIAFPQVLSARQQDARHWQLWLTGPSEILTAVCNQLAENKIFQVSSEPLSSVAATCTGSTTGEIPTQISRCLQTEKIPVSQMLLSPMSVVVFVAQSDHKRALASLHKLV